MTNQSADIRLNSKEYNDKFSCIVCPRLEQSLSGVPRSNPDGQFQPNLFDQEHSLSFTSGYRLQSRGIQKQKRSRIEYLSGKESNSVDNLENSDEKSKLLN